MKHTLKRNRNEHINCQYSLATATKLSEVYKTWSGNKQKGYDFCISDMKEHDGFGFRILGANCYQFSCAYLYAHPDTGEIRIVKHTAKYCYDYPY